MKGRRVLTEEKFEKFFLLFYLRKLVENKVFLLTGSRREKQEELGLLMSSH